MQHHESVTQLANITDPSEVLYAVTMQDVLAAIAKRIGGEALTLSVEELELAREEVKEAINHNLDIREYIDMGLDAWEIVRHL